MRNELEEIQVSVNDEPLKWNTLQIPRMTVDPEIPDHLKASFPPGSVNRLRDVRPRFNAFRFRCPMDQVADLNWVHGVPEQLGQWFILGARDLDTYDTQWVETQFRDWNLNFPDAPLPPGNEYLFQEVTGRRFLPGEEYFVCIAVPDEASGTVRAALQLTPSKPRPRAKSAAEIANRMGLTLSSHTLPQTPAGLQAAFENSERWARDDSAEGRSVWRNVESVWDMIPEIEITREAGKPVWNRLQPNSPFQFHAVRFRSPFDHPTDLRSCVISDQQIRQGVISRTGDVKRWNGDWLEVNLPFPDGSRPNENLVNWRDLESSEILPGEEYIIWFAPYRRAMLEFEFAIHLSAAGSIASTSRGRSAPVFGLTLQDELTSKRVDVALDLAQTIAREKLSTTTMEFDRLMQFVAPALPVLRLSTGEIVWNECQMTRSVAYRIEDDPKSGNLLVSVVNPAGTGMEWGIGGLGQLGLQHGFRVSMPAKRVEVPKGFDGFIETGVFNGYNNRIPRSTVLFCYLGEKTLAATVQIAVRANVIGRPNAPVTPQEMMEAMGILFANSLQGELLGSHQLAVLKLAFLSDSVLASTSQDNSLQLWNLENKKSPLTMRVPAFLVTGLAMSADHGLIACLTASQNNVVGSAQVSIHDGKTLKQKNRLQIPTNHFPKFVTISPDGRSALSCDGGETTGRSSTLCVWNVAAAQPARVMTFEPRTQVFSAHWLHDGKTIVASGGKSWKDPEPRNSTPLFAGEIRLIDSETFEIQRTLTDPGDMWMAQSLSGDGKRLGVLSDKGFIKVLDVQSLKPVASLFHEKWGTQIELSADGSRLVSMTRDGKVLIWDVDRDCLIQQWPEAVPQIRTVAMASSGKQIALGRADNQVRIFTVDESKLPEDSTRINSLKMQLARIPAGEFEMGSGGPDAKHLVKLTNAFYLGRHEVTVGQFRAFVEATGYRTTVETSGKGGMHRPLGKELPEAKPEWNWKNPGFEQTDRHPVVQISWHDAVAFCEWLSKTEGKTYRLPTEAEWEYASRDGEETRNWFWGNIDIHVPHGANIADAEIQKFYGKYRNAIVASDGYPFTAPVGSYAHSRFGLYDMHGNAQEWCLDQYAPLYYSTSPGENPKGPATGTGRVQRGGSYAHREMEATCNHRFSDVAEAATSTYGFRIVMEDQ